MAGGGSGAASLAWGSEPASAAARSTATATAPCRENIVVRGADPLRAAAIREHAESIRQLAFSQLLGVMHPQPWLAPCEIHVHATHAAFARALGGPPGDARGATSLEFSADRVIMRRIDVIGDGAEVVPDAIDHELVHVVLADHFVHAAPPRWADEGLALLFDSVAKQRGHEADFQDAQRRGLAWDVSDLLSIEDYPIDAARLRVFYGQSAALVRWLVERRDAATFIRLLDDADSIGIEAALQRHYGIDSLASVSSAWKEVAPINSLGLSERSR